MPATAKSQPAGGPGAGPLTTIEVLGGAVDEQTSTTVTGPTELETGSTGSYTATVTPAPAGGTIQFQISDVDAGAPVDVDSNGVAVLPAVDFNLPGTFTITAVYSGAPGFTGSTSAPVTVTVTDPVVTKIDTVTELTGPASATAGTAAQYTATVSPAEAEGAVQFSVGGTAVGAPVPVVGGLAEFEHTFADDGTYTVTAQFVGADPYQDSASNSLSVTVGDGGHRPRPGSGPR